MKKFTATLLLAGMMLSQFTLRADEGMWLVSMLNRITMAEAQGLGLNLSAEEIYDINNASLKDAIVRLNGGSCTGEVISSQGLVLTNHHCAYDAIQGFSSTENDYLTDGFFALAHDQEMHIDDFVISFLVRIDDVTSRILENVTMEMSEDERNAAIRDARKALMEEMNPEGDKELQLKSFYYDNEFYMFEYKTYRDIRLVAAPPESVGKYGGDTDNWMWPRHTGDFSMLRIYADENNEPADFSENNVPYQPKRHLRISMDGVSEGDFTMVMGYPGSTDRFLSSWGIDQALRLYNPSVVDVRDLKLKTMKSHMDADPAVRIQYAAKYAQTANYWKYYIGQSKGLKRLDVESKKQALEARFTDWVNADTDRQAEYGEALGLIQSYYEDTDASVQGKVYALEAGLIGCDISLFSFRFYRMAAGLFSEDAEEVAATQAAMTDLANGFFKEYDQATDRDLFVNLMTKFRDDIDPAYHPSFFATVADKYKNDFNRFADKMYAKSFLVDADRCAEFIANPSQKVMDKDLAIIVGQSAIQTYFAGQANPAEDKFNRGYRLFVKGLRDMDADQAIAPDANSTMRMTFGSVAPYKAADAVNYDFITTANGILEKKDNSNPEFIVPDALDDLIRSRDFGQYADESGELVVCFIHGTDITGGNSGSPVLDANGDLIGCAFDGNWEAMSGDIAFETELQRTISVDIRYVTWILDKFAGAQNLIDEMDFVSGLR
ncbi:MAG TPA: serine protease [Flavobacteriales bacterium]|nr:serine protease [Flavobacteriales bacterium]|tara:strand:+ start:1840 stop:3999 length:2160 start_codon:yes stop_codon:yes gene_type:complete